MKDKIASLIPEKFRRYPFVTWVFFVATVLVFLYAFADVFGIETLREWANHWMGLPRDADLDILGS